MEYDRDKVDEMVLALLWLTPAGDGTTVPVTYEELYEFRNRTS